MNRIPLIIGLFLMLSALLIGCSEKKQQQLRKRIPHVQTGTVTKSDVLISRSYVANLQAGRQANILAKTSGYIRAWHADRGDAVKKGQRLATIESEELKLIARQSEAQAQSAGASLEMARKNMERIGQLAEKNLVPVAETDNAQIALQMAQAQVEAAQSSRKLSEHRTSYADITAPFAGYIIARNAEVGTLVSPSGPVLFVLGELETIKSVCSIPQADVPYITVGKLAKLSVQGLETRIFEGKITRVAPSLSPSTRTLEIEIDFENKDEVLMPGMFGRVTIDLDEIKGALLLDPRAISRSGQKGIVYKVENSIAKQVEIEIGRTLADGRVEVIKGVNEGEEIIIVGRDLVRNDMEVRAVKFNGDT